MAHSDLISYAAMRAILAGLGFSPEGSSSSPSGAHLLVYGKRTIGLYTEHAEAYLPTGKRGKARIEIYLDSRFGKRMVKARTYKVTRDAATGEWVAT